MKVQGRTPGKQALVPASPVSAPAPSSAPIVVGDAPSSLDVSAPLRREDAFSAGVDLSPPSVQPPAFAEAADPAFREVQHSTDALLQTGRANLGERYAEAIREFEERRR